MSTKRTAHKGHTPMGAPVVKGNVATLHRERGERWCTAHHHFAPAASMVGQNSLDPAGTNCGTAPKR